MKGAAELSVVVVAGPVRNRAQKVMNRLSNQTAGERMEVVVVDLEPETVLALEIGNVAAVQYLRRPAGLRWGQARAAGWRAAVAPVVAFLEDHCFPARTWAAKVMEAHGGPWAAVGYAFSNANPECYVSRASFVLDYGLWSHPLPAGTTGRLQSNNISYKREWMDRCAATTGLGLDELLENDWNIQQAMRGCGGQLYLESSALAMHHNFTTLAEIWEENFFHCQTLGAARAGREGWALPRRVAQGLATPAAAPLIRAWRFVTAMRGRPGPRPDWVRAFPVLAAGFLASALGEAAGYLAGFGDSDTVLKKALLASSRR